MKDNKIKKNISGRYLLPDTLRGALVIAMAVYHLLFDLYYLYDVNMPWFRNTGMRIFQTLILAGFVSISGFCFSWGKRKLFRAAQVFVCGIIITVVTWIFMPSQRIVFGVLTCLSICMLMMIPLEKTLSKIPPVVGSILFFTAALLTYGVRSGYIGIYTHPLFELPDFLYSTDFLFPLGFKNASFRSSDYVPLFPWLFLYISGFFTSLAVRKSQKATALLHFGSKPLAAVGRYSLWIYLAHQPLIYGILWVIFKMIRKDG